MQKKKLSNDQKKALLQLKKLLQAIEGNPAEKRFTDKI